MVRDRQNASAQALRPELPDVLEGVLVLAIPISQDTLSYEEKYDRNRFAPALASVARLVGHRPTKQKLPV